MAILHNPRHEKFAQLLAQGMSAVQAFVAAGYAYSTGNAARLSANESVKRRVEELTREATGLAGISIKRVVGEVAKVAFASLGDYISIDESGQPQVDFSKLDRDKLAALGEVQREERTVAPEGQPVTTIKKVRFKLHSKLDALEKLGRYLGAWERGATVVQPPQITIQQYDFNKLSDDELQQLLAIKKKLMLHSPEAK